MSATDKYISILKKVIADDGLPLPGEPFTFVESETIREIARAGKIRISDNATETKPLTRYDISITLETRLLLDKLIEDRKNKVFFRNPYFLGIMTGLVLNIASHILIKPLDIFFDNKYRKPEAHYHYDALNESVEPESPVIPSP